MKTVLDMTPDFNREDDGYEAFLSSVRAEFEKNLKGDTTPLFTTDADGLFDLFLDNLPADARQHYTCRTCRRFVDTYGGLIRIDENGSRTPAMWATASKIPEFFAPAVQALRKAVKDAKVTGVFVSSYRTLGTPATGSWTHLSAVLPDRMVYRGRVDTAEQVMAKKAEEHRMLLDAIRKYRTETVKSAVGILSTDSLYRSEKVLGIAEWFFNLKNTIESKPRKESSGIIWYAVATAPVGFCHISSSMIGTLLDDIEAGLDMDAVSRRFADKMHPLKYQRPQAAPSRGNVEQAEKIVEKLGIQNSLLRRYARIEELETIWRPSVVAEPKKTGGVFSGVRTKEQTYAGDPKKLVGKVDGITFDKFRREVLGKAKKIEFLVPAGSAPYSAIVTAADESAPPILKWDSEEKRNPFSWYVYHGGSYPSSWNLMQGYVNVTGVVMQPNMWTGKHDHEGKAVIFILEGCRDTNYRSAGCGLFPEILKSELHEVRSTIEAYSRQNVISGYEEATACGIRIQANTKCRAAFRVTTDFGVTEYIIDRFD